MKRKITMLFLTLLMTASVACTNNTASLNAVEANPSTMEETVQESETTVQLASDTNEVDESNNDPAFLGSIYLAFSFTEMYVHMPLKVCCNCVYYKLENSLCISGLNIVSRRIAKEGCTKAFSNRAKGVLCPNNLYIASLVVPIIAIIPALEL